MSRPPILATLLAAAAVAAMVGLGLWQLDRAEWKDRLIAEHRAAAALPPVDLDPLLARDSGATPPLSFRRARASCAVHDAEPALRGGRGPGDAGGYSYFVPCRPGAPGLAGRLRVDAGWSPLPDGSLRLTLDGPIEGRLGLVADEGPVTLTAADAAPPLRPSVPPSVEDIPTSHRMYAAQWFFFAATALLIYVLALKRRRRDWLADS